VSEQPEQLRMGAIANPQSPEGYRIKNVVSNMPEFQQAFSCYADGRW
jgi:predicted metalloendopeptidase